MIKYIPQSIWSHVKWVNSLGKDRQKILMLEVSTNAMFILTTVNETRGQELPEIFDTIKLSLLIYSQQGEQAHQDIHY